MKADESEFRKITGDQTDDFFILHSQRAFAKKPKKKKSIPYISLGLTLDAYKNI